MFTGIVQGTARIDALADRPGLRTFTLAFPPGFCTGLEIGASVAVNGVCLTVTALRGADAADFDVVRRPENNHVIRFGVPPAWMRYVFAKGYIAINGASLTVAEADRREGWFEVWLIPETLRMTTFADKAPGATVNLEIERATQVMVDSVRDAVDERLGPLLPALRGVLSERGIDVDALLA